MKLIAVVDGQFSAGVCGHLCFDNYSSYKT